MTSPLVVDASVCLKWYLRDENLLEQADQLLEDWKNQRVILVQPVFVIHEFGHAILRARAPAAHLGSNRDPGDERFLQAVRAFRGGSINPGGAIQL
jgi:predicted nucleic acid-binding protein